MQSFVAAEEPGATAAPICVAGFTDSHWLREAFGTVAYGFFPARTLDAEVAARLIHSADERVPVDDLELGLRFLLHAADRLWLSSTSLEELEAFVDELAPDEVADVFLSYRLGDLRRRRGRRRRSRVRCRSSPRVGSDTGSDPGQTPGHVRIGEWVPTWSPEEYAAAVGEVRAAIARGDVYQVNLVQHLSAPFEGDPHALAEALAPLRPLHPRPLAGDGWAVVSASPELFLARRGDRIWTKPIKGTRPIGEDIDDPKDAAEHVMIVDLERNDLSRVCEVGQHPLARADGAARARRRDASRLDRGRTASPRRRPRRDPAGDVPRRFDHRRAEDLRARPHRAARAGRPRRVDGCARHDRGNGDFDFALTIRTFAIAEGAIHLWVGGGVVWDSDPDGRDRGVVGEGAAAARSGRRPRAGMTLLAVAVAGRGLVDPDEPVFGADDEALLRGGAAFETIRVYGGRPFLLAEHLARFRVLRRRARARPPTGSSELVELVSAPRRRTTCCASTGRAMRSSRRRRASPGGLDELRARGIALVSFEVGTPPPLLGGAKTTSYGLSFAARREAERLGADDALLARGRPRARGRDVERVVAARRPALHTRRRGPASSPA